MCSASIFLVRAHAGAQELPALPHNNYGSPGLIDMPSARMAPDGELSAGAFYVNNIQRYSLGFQALPWLEADFRYSGLQHFDPLYPVYYDRSFALKIRMWDETDVFPAVSVGLNDVVGTGAYGGEYVVASKRFGPVDATLGMGWGRMGTTALLRNPLSLISSSFDTRGDVFGVSSNPGAANFKTLFHGHDVGLFGGVAWATPVDGLTLMAEYSSDSYPTEAARGTFIPRDQVNLGAAYQLTDSIGLGVNWLYGRAVGANIAFTLDPVHDPYPQRLSVPPIDAHIRTGDEQRAALDSLVGMHDQTRVMQASLRSRAFLANGELVDKLWRFPNLADVTLNGHVMALTVTQGDIGQACRSAAAFIGQYSTTITAVRVSHARQSTQCPVAASPALARLNAPLDTMPALTLASLSDMAPTLIDASTRSAAGDRQAIARIKADALKQKIAIAAVRLNASEALVYYGNGKYFSEVDAIERLTRILMQDAPPEIEKFRFITVINGITTREFSVLRAPTERTFTQTGSFDFQDDVEMSAPPMHNPVLMAAASKTYPQFSWFIFPQFRQQLFDPQNPFGVQFLAGLDAALALAPGLTISGQFEASLFDTFTTNRPADSDLPHVRTDFLQYFTKGKNGIAFLNAEYQFRVAPTVFASVRAGYLESMFAGVGGEVLWRPEGQRWALGADLFEVQKRGFDRLLDLQDYRALTGHVALYYASPFYDLDFTVRAGEYLAHDRGITFEISRRFSTGVEIGAFFTTTNVSAQQFGEGSFDKGIMIRIPLNWVAPIDTQSQFSMDLRPVQRDGGQRLDGDARLFYETRRASLEELQRVQGIAVEDN